MNRVYRWYRESYTVKSTYRKQPNETDRISNEYKAYSQLGLTSGVMDGTADENTMNNYYTRTIEPISYQL